MEILTNDITLHQLSY